VRDVGVCVFVYLYACVCLCVLVYAFVCKRFCQCGSVCCVLASDFSVVWLRVYTYTYTRTLHIFILICFILAL
jgi:hypothetical protein